MINGMHSINYLLCVTSIDLSSFRGKEFRTDFARVGEIRSVLHVTTNIMALTATATLNTRKVVIEALDMKGC